MKNKEVLEAAKEFERCQRLDLAFKVKYAMAKNLERIKRLEKRAQDIKNVQGDEECVAFLQARQEFFKTHDLQNQDEQFLADWKIVEDAHSGAVTKLKALEEEFHDFLDSETDLEVYDISSELIEGSEDRHPDTGKINLSLILGFLR